jgi:hypothetical protein
MKKKVVALGVFLVTFRVMSAAPDSSGRMRDALDRVSAMSSEVFQKLKDLFEFGRTDLSPQQKVEYREFGRTDLTEPQKQTIHIAQKDLESGVASYASSINELKHSETLTPLRRMYHQYVIYKTESLKHKVNRVMGRGPAPKAQFEQARESTR